jgi:hypothetical protein
VFSWQIVLRKSFGILSPRFGREGASMDISQQQFLSRRHFCLCCVTGAAFDRNIATGNPYKDLVADLAKRGVQIVRRYREGSRLGQRRPASGRKGQHGCHGENDAARPGRIRQDIGIGSKVFAKPEPKARLASFLPTTQADTINADLLALMKT